ncbi:MAG: hypothetical protein AAFU85_00480 [Planctomycetota bacterium]
MLKPLRYGSGNPAYESNVRVESASNDATEASSVPQQLAPVSATGARHSIGIRVNQRKLTSFFDRD